VTHHLTFGADFVFFGNLLWTFAIGTSDYKTFSHVWPLVLASISVSLLMVDPTRHILLDHGSGLWYEDSFSMYFIDSGAVHLTSAGRFCQRVTAVGMVLLVVAVSGFSGIFQRLSQFVGNRSQSGAAC